jgi:hypothetical protein
MKHELIARDSARKLEPVQKVVPPFDVGQRSLGRRWVVVERRDRQGVRVLYPV